MRSVLQTFRSGSSAVPWRRLLVNDPPPRRVGPVLQRLGRRVRQTLPIPLLPIASLLLVVLCWRHFSEAASPTSSRQRSSATVSPQALVKEVFALLSLVCSVLTRVSFMTVCLLLLAAGLGVAGDQVQQCSAVPLPVRVCPHWLVLRYFFVVLILFAPCVRV